MSFVPPNTTPYSPPKRSYTIFHDNDTQTNWTEFCDSTRPCDPLHIDDDTYRMRFRECAKTRAGDKINTTHLLRPSTLALNMFVSGPSGCDLYVFYDSHQHCYQLFGFSHTKAPFHFCCEFAHELVEWLSIIIDNQRSIYTLYVANHLPEHFKTDTLKTEMICEWFRPSHQFLRKENVKYKQKYTLNLLRSLRNMFNYK